MTKVITQQPVNDLPMTYKHNQNVTDKNKFDKWCYVQLKTK